MLLKNRSEVPTDRYYAPIFDKNNYANKLPNT